MSRGSVDTALMWLTDLFCRCRNCRCCCCSIYLFRDTLKPLVGPELGVFLLIVAVIGGLRWMQVARLVRAQFLSLREKEFVEAARALGATTRRQVVRHILPNSLGPVIVAGTVDVAAAIIAESTLSFLGLGFPPDTPTWGRILYRRQGQPRYRAALGIVRRRRDLSRGAVDQLRRRRAARRARPPQGDVMDAPRRPSARNPRVEDDFETDDGIVQRGRRRRPTIDRGETLGVVGESGCGKTVTALSVLKLIADAAGPHRRRPDPLARPRPRAARPAAMRRIRGKEIGIVFQEPMTSLNPVYTVGEQIAEAVRVHEGLARRAAFDRAVEMLQLVHIPNARSARARLSAPVLGRHAPARDDRDGAGLPARSC